MAKLSYDDRLLLARNVKNALGRASDISVQVFQDSDSEIIIRASWKCKDPKHRP